MSDPSLPADPRDRFALPPRRNLNTNIPELDCKPPPPAQPPSTLESPEGAPDISATDENEDFLRRNYSYDDIIQRDGKAKYFAADGMPYIAALKGFGRYRMAVHADDEHQMNILHRSMSCLDAKFIKHCNLDMSGIDREIVSKYKALRLENEYSSISSQSSSVSNPPDVTLDESRGCPVIRGFSTSSSASSAASSFGSSVRHFRKSSSFSSVSSSDSHRIRHKSRQASLQVSAASGTSPLTTIVERPEQRRKPQKQCTFDNGNTESALASGASDSEDEWHDVTDFSGSIRRMSQLSQQIAVRRRQPSDGKTMTRLQTKSNEQQISRYGKGIDRNKTIKPTQRPAIRRTNSKNSDTKKRELQAASHMATACQARPIPSQRGQSSQSIEQAWSQELTKKKGQAIEMKPPKHRCGSYIAKGFDIDGERQSYLEGYMLASRESVGHPPKRLGGAQKDVSPELREAQFKASPRAHPPKHQVCIQVKKRDSPIKQSRHSRTPDETTTGPQIQLTQQQHPHRKADQAAVGVKQRDFAIEAYSPAAKLGKEVDAKSDHSDSTNKTAIPASPEERRVVTAISLMQQRARSGTAFKICAPKIQTPEHVEMAVGQTSRDIVA